VSRTSTQSHSPNGADVHCAWYGGSTLVTEAHHYVLETPKTLAVLEQALNDNTRAGATIPHVSVSKGYKIYSYSPRKYRSTPSPRPTACAFAIVDAPGQARSGQRFGSRDFNSLANLRPGNVSPLTSADTDTLVIRAFFTTGTLFLSPEVR
jgi:hypothetical protein